MLHSVFVIIFVSILYHSLYLQDGKMNALNLITDGDNTAQINCRAGRVKRAESRSPRVSSHLHSPESSSNTAQSNQYKQHSSFSDSTGQGPSGQDERATPVQVNIRNYSSFCMLIIPRKLV